MIPNAKQSPIDGVILQLEDLVKGSLDQPTRLGYFASLYLRVTNTIRSKIGTGYFDDDARMERLDASFASRYLDAVRQFQAKDPKLPQAWAVALNAVAREDLIVVQHLLLAMNPHINLDLAAACAETCPGDSIDTLHGDFLKINTLLGGIVPTVILEMGEVSPCARCLSDLAEGEEHGIINFNIDAARDFAWDLAKTLARLSPDDQQVLISQKNVFVAALGTAITLPDPVARCVVRCIRESEPAGIDQIIRVLDNGNPVVEGLEIPAPQKETAPNRAYYFEIAPGTWAGSFTFKLTSWRLLWGSSMSFVDKLLASMMAIFQKAFGNASVSSVITPYPDRGAFGVATNDLRIFKSWLQLLHSSEEYTLLPNGSGVKVDAHVSFGPIPFLFREHDIYPANVQDGGFRNLYHIRLLGTRFLGDYRVQPDRKQVLSTLENEWAVAHEALNKAT
ncbi:MAG: hypothetical protein DMF53_27875 [Acidobacteria bacterium]|nr:MAG: hypothetical protein DMF53_27875 [Acidobacteriota bacterium]